MNPTTLRRLRAEYPTGTRIQLQYMEGESGMPDGLMGTVSCVDDAGQIQIDWDNGSTLALNPDLDSFRTLEQMEVLLVQVDRGPCTVLIDGSLESLQNLVGGRVELIQPFNDDTVILCNEEGKLLGLPPNRALRDPDGEIYDVICGDFFVAYAPPDSENFLSMPKHLLAHYAELFRYPEQLFMTDGKLYAVPFCPTRSEHDCSR